MFDWILNMFLINYHSVLILKSMLSFKLLFFDFLRKETLTLLTMLVKTICGKVENDIRKYNHWYSQKNMQKFQQFHFPAVFMNGNIEYPQFLVQRRFCQLQINFLVMASLYIYKLKINAKLQEKTFARWDMSIHYVPTVSCVNVRSQSFFKCFD